MRSPPQWAKIKPVAVRMNVLRDRLYQHRNLPPVGRVRQVQSGNRLTGFGLRMQRRLNLLLTELVERIGFVGSELMTQLREKRVRLV